LQKRLARARRAAALKAFSRCSIDDLLGVVTRAQHVDARTALDTFAIDVVAVAAP